MFLRCPFPNFLPPAKNVQEVQADAVFKYDEDDYRFRISSSSQKVAAAESETITILSTVPIQRSQNHDQNTITLSEHIQKQRSLSLVPVRRHTNSYDLGFRISSRKKHWLPYVWFILSRSKASRGVIKWPRYQYDPSDQENEFDASYGLGMSIEAEKGGKDVIRNMYVLGPFWILNIEYWLKKLLLKL